MRFIESRIEPKSGEVSWDTQNEDLVYRSTAVDSANRREFVYRSRYLGKVGRIIGTVVVSCEALTADIHNLFDANTPEN